MSNCQEIGVVDTRYQQRKFSCWIFGFCIPTYRCIQHTRNIQFRNNRRVNTEQVQNTFTLSFLIDTHFHHPLLRNCRKNNYTQYPFHISDEGKHESEYIKNSQYQHYMLSLTQIFISEICFKMCICIYVKSFFPFF